MHRVLVVDDEPKLLFSLKQLLETEGFEVETAENIQEAESLASKFKPDAIILDILLGEENGLEFCRDLSLKKSHPPVLVLSALADVENRLEGFENGADDYLNKPFDNRELTARLNALLKRTSKMADSCQFDINLNFLSDGGSQSTHLTKIEARLLIFLIENEDQWSPSDTMIEKVWCGTSVSKKTFETHVSNLRRKLREFDIEVENQFGVGYRIKGSIRLIGSLH